MAFNIQTFKTRTLTAIIFAAIMLIGLLWNQWSFLILFSIIHFGCWWEYLRLTEKIHSTYFHPYIKLGLMMMGYGIMLWFCNPSFQIYGYGLKENISLPVSSAGFALLLTGIFQKNPIHIKAFGVAALGFLYVSLCWGFMMDLYRETDIHIQDTVFVIAGYFLPMFVIASIWVNDTMAYIVGSLIGRTPLSKISPKKTWEGTLGGIFLAMILAGVFAWSLNYDKFLFITIAALVAITGTFGDLLESKIKRTAEVKDSGSLMPGHGGFLDRFDSLLLATPIVWIFIQLLVK